MFNQCGRIWRNTVGLESSCQRFRGRRISKVSWVFFCQKLVKKGRNRAVKTFLLSWSVMRNSTAERAPSGAALNMCITGPYRVGLWLRPSLQESPCCRQEQAAISHQDFSLRISSMASATLPGYLWGSLKPRDWHWQTSLSYMLMSILSHPCLEKQTPFWTALGQWPLPTELIHSKYLFPGESLGNDHFSCSKGV